jgi:hypothetical protein
MLYTAKLFFVDSLFVCLFYDFPKFFVKDSAMSILNPFILMLSFYYRNNAVSNFME